MRANALLASALVLAGCSNFKEGEATTPPPDGSAPAAEPVSDAAIDAEAGAAPPYSDPTPTFDGGVTVDTLLSGRSRIGAFYSEAGSMWAWRTGLVANGSALYWVEGGTEPGVYSAPLTCTSNACVKKLATIAAPTAFAATETHVYVADKTAIKRYAFATGNGENVAGATKDIINLAGANLDGGVTNIFWTAGTDPAIEMTTFGKGTSVPISSNGTPIRMAAASDRVFWGGVDITGVNSALQSIRVDGTGVRADQPFSGGFSAMGGNGTYLYYATASPGVVHRYTVSSRHDEILEGQSYDVTDFAFDEAYAYWVEGGDGDFLNGRVRRVAHTSTKPETLADAMPLPVAITLSGGTLYVASAGTKAKSYADGAIVRVRIAGQ